MDIYQWQAQELRVWRSLSTSRAVKWQDLRWAPQNGSASAESIFSKCKVCGVKNPNSEITEQGIPGHPSQKWGEKRERSSGNLRSLPSLFL